jgi:cytoskeleton protein RodZ
MTDKSTTGDETAVGGPEQVEAFDPLPGDLLREARNRRGWTIARVAEDMNLEARFVEAMEDNRFEDLGAPVFARGHLRKYARLLEVDMERLMDAYAEIERERIPPPVASVEGLTMTGDVPPGRRGWRAILILIVLGLLAAVAWRLLAPRPDAGAPAGEGVGQSSPPDSVGPDVELDEEPVAVPLPALVTGGEAPEPPSEEDDSEAVAETAADGEEPTPAAPSTDADPAQRTRARATEADGVELVLRFSADSWVEVRDASGDRILYQLGRTGQQRAVRGDPPFDIFLGFADGVSIEFDGEAISIPAGARLGRTARFRLPVDTAAFLRS